MKCALVLTGYWPFGLVMCDVWQLSDVVMCTSSIMHMCTISLDRYNAIRDPLRSRAARASSRTTFCMKIGAVWLASTVIGSPLIVLGVLSPGDVLSEDGQCAIVNAYYVVYGSLAAFFGPLTIMLVTFILTVRLLEREATQLAADRNDGMRRYTADRKPYPAPAAAAIVTRTSSGATTGSAGRRRRTMRLSWMSRFSRSEVPTSTSILPSPIKYTNETALANTTSGLECGDFPHPVDSRASRDTQRDEAVDNRTATQVSPSTTACCDRPSSTRTGSCVVEVSTSPRAPHAGATSATCDDVTNMESSLSSDCRAAAKSIHVSRRPEDTSARGVTCTTSSSREPITDEKRISNEQQKFTALVKSVSEFAAVRRPEVILQRRSVEVTSLNSLGKMADWLMVSLQPGNVDGERRCLLKHSNDTKRYVADSDVIKLLPVQLTDEPRCTCAQYGLCGPLSEHTAMRRSRSDSAVGIQPLTCFHGDVIQSRDQTALTGNVDVGGGPVNDVITDAQRPLSGDVATTTTNAASASQANCDVIVVDDGNNGAGNPGRGPTPQSANGSEKFKDLIRKHGAAFHVAGMLRATREDRQQKAFNSVKTESKAVKVLGTMFAIFVTCWAPFFTANLIMGLCSSCYVDPLLFKVGQP